MKNNNFKRIHTTEGNTIINTNEIVTLDEDNFGPKGKQTFRLTIETTAGKTLTFHWSEEDYGEDAREMRENAIEFITGLTEDD